MRKMAFTGHRPPKIGGYNDDAPLRIKVKQAIGEILDQTLVTDPDLEAIVGGALGVDTDAAREAYRRSIPYHLYAPCHNQDSKWPVSSQQRYQKMLELAASVRYVHDGSYTSRCMQERNIAMVDDCDILVAVWDGTSGGTANCVAYAESVGREIIRINPREL